MERRICLSFESLHSLYHEIDRGDSFVGRGSSELCLLCGFVETGGDGLGFLVDGSLGRFKVASDEFEGHFEERGVEDQLVIGNKFCEVSHPLAPTNT